MKHLISRVWRGGRLWDPPMLLVAFFFYGIWLLWPMDTPVTPIADRPPRMHVSARPSMMVADLPDARRPDRFVRRSNERGKASGLGEALTGWLDISHNMEVHQTEKREMWWFPRGEGKQERMLESDAFQSLITHPALTQFDLPRMIDEPLRVAASAMVVTVSAPLRDAGFVVPQEALNACVQTVFPWEVKVSIASGDGRGLFPDVLVLSGHDDASVNHGVVRAIGMGRSTSPCQGVVTVSWPGKTN